MAIVISHVARVMASVSGLHISSWRSRMSCGDFTANGCGSRVWSKSSQLDADPVIRETSYFDGISFCRACLAVSSKCAEALVLRSCSDSIWRPVSTLSQSFWKSERICDGGSVASTSDIQNFHPIHSCPDLTMLKQKLALALERVDFRSWPR